MYRMNTLLYHRRAIAIVCCIALTSASGVLAQKAGLRGGSALLNNGSNIVTFAVPATGLSSYRLTLPSTQSAPSSIQWIGNDGTGLLSWVSAPAGLGGLAVNFSPGNPQQTATSPHYLFYLQSLKPGAGSSSMNSATPGALITSTVDGVSENATGLTINVGNTLASATGVTVTGLSLHSGTLKAAGTPISNNYGLSVNVSGGGTNYAALFTAGNVGIGTSTPSESLEVNGNIRISGQNGLMITEGTNATMGKATLVAGTIVVNTSSVTANSRIFLMDQAPNGGAPGTSYISARTAGTSFTITSTNAADVSDVAWWIVEP